MNEQLNVFLEKLIGDKKLREEFARDPKGVLAREKIDLPAEFIPSTIDANKLEERLNALQLLASNIQSSRLKSFQIDKASLLAGLQRPDKIIPGKPGLASNNIITTS
jgi:hypothetical protein